jgi:hypothetical protein
MRAWRSRPIVAVVALALFLAATALAAWRSTSSHRGASPAAAVGYESAADADEANSEQLDWSQIFADGEKLPDIATAASRLPFRPVAPAAIGRLRAIFVHRGVKSRARQALGLVIDHPAYGRFLLSEEPTTMTAAQLATIAARCDPAHGCEGTWRMVSLPNGTPALLVAGPASTGLLWLRKSVRFDVYGPPDTFTVASATDVANTIAIAP